MYLHVNKMKPLTHSFFIIIKHKPINQPNIVTILEMTINQPPSIHHHQQQTKKCVIEKIIPITFFLSCRAN